MGRGAQSGLKFKVEVILGGKLGQRIESDEVKVFAASSRIIEKNQRRHCYYFFNSRDWKGKEESLLSCSWGWK